MNTVEVTYHIADRYPCTKNWAETQPWPCSLEWHKTPLGFLLDVASWTSRKLTTSFRVNEILPSSFSWMLVFPKVRYSHSLYFFYLLGDLLANTITHVQSFNREFPLRCLISSKTGRHANNNTGRDCNIITILLNSSLRHFLRGFSWSSFPLNILHSFRICALIQVIYGWQIPPLFLTYL